MSKLLQYSAVQNNTAQFAKSELGPILGRQLLMLVGVGLAFWLLWDRLPQLELSEVWHAIQQVSVKQWVLASLATLTSFWAVGHYDQVVHGLLNTGLRAGPARRSGRAAVAIAQFAGFGVLSSALVRWRLLPGMSLSGALRLSLVVSLSFLAAWAVLCAFAILLTDISIYNLRVAAWAVVGLAMLALVLLTLQPARFGRLPSIRAVLTIVGLAFIDTASAGLALYILLPETVSIAPTTLFTAYLIALGAGLIGSTPGGIGPFELALLALLPGIAQEPLLATALAFRIIYYVIPAIIGFVWLLPKPGKGSQQNCPKLAKPATSPFLQPSLETLLWKSPRAEANLLRQGDFSMLQQNLSALALAAPTGQSLIMLSDPVQADWPTRSVLRVLQKTAKRTLRAPLVYKCSAKTAVAARQLGWAVLPVAQEAWVNPTTYSTETAKYRQLRRLLRKAERNGVTVREGARKLPMDAMASITREWSRTHGGERGFSMGRFGRDYVSCQRVFLAYRKNKLIAFITLHEVQKEWTLDLMRHADDISDGTMHLLLHSAILSAAAVFCPRLSLAALPCASANDTAIVARLRHYLIQKSNTAGLRRFKSCFDPNWEPLYAAAPGQTSLWLGLWAVKNRVIQSR